MFAAEAQLKMVSGVRLLPLRYSHKRLDVIAKVAHAVPLVDPVIANFTPFVILVGFNQTERPQGTIDDFDPKVNVISISLSSIDSDG